MGFPSIGHGCDVLIVIYLSVFVKGLWKYILKPNLYMEIEIQDLLCLEEFCLRKDRTFSRLFVRDAWQRQGTV